MSTENQTEEVITTEETAVEVTATAFDPFLEQPETEQKTNVQIETTNVAEETVGDTIKDVTAEEKTEEEIRDANEYLKENLGFDDWDSAKAAVAELKELKEKAQTPAEIKFANDEAKKLFEYIKEGKTDEVLEILNTQKTLAAVDKMDAAAAIKLKIKQDNKHFTQDDIQDVFEEKYSLDEKPSQDIDELDEEFTKRLNKWQVKTEKVTRRIERDAVSAKTELSKLRSELVLPDIFKKEPEVVKATEPTPEELARNKAYTESFLKSVETSLKQFSGLTATVKDKDVEIPIAYQATDEQKTKISNDLKLLADNNYDANILFATRWLQKDGTLNTEQITKDYFRVLYGEQAEQKFANEAASKRVVEKTKKDSNIQIKSNTTPQRTFSATNTEDERNKLAEYMFAHG